MNKTRQFQDRALRMLSGKIDDFYLGGGTALSLFYFQHRESLDLDFFTHVFSKIRILQITRIISDNLKRKIELVGQESRNNRAKVAIYSIYMDRKESLKIDFVEDYLDLIKPAKTINGIKIMSLEDIYIRKIFALTGTLQAEDFIGRKIKIGGRQEAKDFYDLYWLSHIFMALSKFSFRYCNLLTREGIIRWFRTYDRMDVKTGLLELKLNKDIDYRDIELHLKKEIDKILEKEVKFL